MNCIWKRSDVKNVSIKFFRSPQFLCVMFATSDTNLSKSIFINFLFFRRSANSNFHFESFPCNEIKCWTTFHRLFMSSTANESLSCPEAVKPDDDSSFHSFHLITVKVRMKRKPKENLFPLIKSLITFSTFCRQQFSFLFALQMKMFMKIMNSFIKWTQLSQSKSCLNASTSPL